MMVTGQMCCDGCGTLIEEHASVFCASCDLDTAPQLEDARDEVWEGLAAALRREAWWGEGRLLTPTEMDDMRRLVYDVLERVLK